jgi:hypothetical protein
MTKKTMATVLAAAALVLPGVTVITAQQSDTDNTKRIVDIENDTETDPVKSFNHGMLLRGNTMRSNEAFAGFQQALLDKVTPPKEKRQFLEPGQATVEAASGCCTFQDLGD